MPSRKHGVTFEQVAKHDTILVTGNGGILDHHSTLILSPNAE